MMERAASSQFSTASSSWECLLCSSNCDFFGIFDCGHFACHRCALRVHKFGVRADVPKGHHHHRASVCPVCRAPSNTLHLSPDPPARAAGTSDGTTDMFDIEALKRTRGTHRNTDLDCLVLNPTEADKDSLDRGVSLGMALTTLCGKLCPFESCWEEGATGGRTQEPFLNLQYLKEHLKRDHGAQFCLVCLEHRPAFLEEQIAYSDAELERHIHSGCSKDCSAFIGHPPCKFCKKRLYDAEGLLKHMQSAHLTCDLCNIGEFKFTYYKDRGSLDRHFETAHKLCTHRDCSGLDTMLRVFTGDFELQSHMVKAHGTPGGRAGVSLDAFGFRFASVEAETVGSRGRVTTGGGSAGSSAAPSASGGAAASSAHGGAPATGANTQATKIFFDFIGRVEEVDMVAPGRSDAAEAEEQAAAARRGGGRRGGAAAHASAVAAQHVVEDQLEAQRRSDVTLKSKLSKYLNAEQYDRFRAASAQFLSGELKATQYYEQLRRFFTSAQALEDVFDPLIASLPNDDRQHALRATRQMMTCKEAERQRTAAEEQAREERQKQLLQTRQTLQEKLAGKKPAAKKVSSAAAEAPRWTAVVGGASAPAAAAAGSSPTTTGPRSWGAAVGGSDIAFSSRSAGTRPSGFGAPVSPVSPAPPAVPGALSSHVDAHMFPSLQPSTVPVRPRGSHPNPAVAAGLKASDNVWFKKDKR